MNITNVQSVVAPILAPVNVVKLPYTRLARTVI